jgi:hypothetical protein
MNIQWGILGPGKVESLRRTRTLNLASSTRRFNELAVPGIGGVWFGRQIFLATLGVLVAQRARALGGKATNITVANAIEALACWLALQNGPPGDGRVRGRDKLYGLGARDFRFDNASRPSFYVTQPMRMSTVSVLPALGLVETQGGRFNSFQCSVLGDEFVRKVTQEHRPSKNELVEHLVAWVLDKEDRIHTTAVAKALSPSQPLPNDSRVLLEEILRQGTPGSPAANRRRRGDALDWVRARRPGQPVDRWDRQPAQITDAAHWADLQAGASFFSVRDTGLDVLNEIEKIIGSKERHYRVGETEAPRVKEKLAQLRRKAEDFLSLRHEDTEASIFCNELIRSEDEALCHLVGRDGRILRLLDKRVCAGPAFLGTSSADATADPEANLSPNTNDMNWPTNISYRVQNIWWLSLDLEGGLEAQLHPETVVG